MLFHGERWRWITECLVKLGKYEEAIEICNNHIENETHIQSFYNIKAECLEQLGRYEEALECYDKALRHYGERIILYPYDPSNWHKKADFLEKLGRHEEAIECYYKAIECYDEDRFIPESSWLGIAECLEQLEEYELALKCYTKAIALGIPEEKRREECYEKWILLSK